MKVPRRMSLAAYSAFREVASVIGVATNFRPSPSKFRVEESHDPRHPTNPRSTQCDPIHGKARGNSVMRPQTSNSTRRVRQAGRSINRVS